MKKLLVIALAAFCIPLIAMKKVTDPGALKLVTEHVTDSGTPRAFSKIVVLTEQGKLNTPLSEAIKLKNRKDMVQFGGKSPLGAITEDFPLIAQFKPNMTREEAKAAHGKLSDKKIELRLDNAKKRLPEKKEKEISLFDSLNDSDKFQIYENSSEKLATFTTPVRKRNPKAPTGSEGIYIDPELRSIKTPKKDALEYQSSTLDPLIKKLRKDGAFNADIFKQNLITALDNQNFDSSEEYLKELSIDDCEIIIANAFRRNPQDLELAIIEHSHTLTPKTKKQKLKRAQLNLKNITNNIG